MKLYQYIFKENKAQKHINKTMRKDIDSIDTYETRPKVNTTKWRPIYEVIDEAYIKGSKMFSYDFIKECKNSNEAQFILREVTIT